MLLSWGSGLGSRNWGGGGGGNNNWRRVGLNQNGLAVRSDTLLVLGLVQRQGLLLQARLLEDLTLGLLLGKADSLVLELLLGKPNGLGESHLLAELPCKEIFY